MPTHMIAFAGHGRRRPGAGVLVRGDVLDDDHVAVLEPREDRQRRHRRPRAAERASAAGGSAPAGGSSPSCSCSGQASASAIDPNAEHRAEERARHAHPDADEQQAEREPRHLLGHDARGHGAVALEALQRAALDRQDQPQAPGRRSWPPRPRARRPRRSRRRARRAPGPTPPSPPRRAATSRRSQRAHAAARMRVVLRDRRRSPRARPWSAARSPRPGG